MVAVSASKRLCSSAFGSPHQGAPSGASVGGSAPGWQIQASIGMGVRASIAAAVGGELRDGRPLIRSRQQEQDVVGGPRDVEQARILAVGVPQADDVGGAVARL